MIRLPRSVRYLAVAFAFLAVAVGLFAPLPVAAQTDENISIPYWGDLGKTGLVSCRFTGPISATNTQNPCSICHLFLTMKRIIYFALTVLLFIIVPGMISWAGWQIMTAGSRAGQVEEATGSAGNLAWALGLGLGGFVIVNTLFSLFTIKVDVSFIDPSGKPQTRQVALNWSRLNCNLVPQALQQVTGTTDPTGSGDPGDPGNPGDPGQGGGDTGGGTGGGGTGGGGGSTGGGVSTGCADDQHWCEEQCNGEECPKFGSGGYCAPNSPETGCFKSRKCDPCAEPANGYATCTMHGECSFACDPGFQQLGAVCLPSTGPQATGAVPR